MSSYFISGKNRGILYIIEAAIASILIILFLFSFLSVLSNKKVHEDFYEKYYSYLKSLDESGILEEIIKEPRIYKYYFDECFLTLKSENSTLYNNFNSSGNFVTINYFYLSESGKSYLIKLRCKIFQ